MNSREKLWLTLLLGARCPRRCPRCGTSGCASCRLGNPCRRSLPNVFVSRSALVSHSIYLRLGLHCFISEVASKNTRKKYFGISSSRALDLYLRFARCFNGNYERFRRERKSFEKAEHKRLFCTASEKWVKLCFCLPPTEGEREALLPPSEQFAQRGDDQ